MRTAFVSTYPPRHCGIATFTRDLASVAGDREIVALHPADEPIQYPHEVHHRVRRDEKEDYARVARTLGRCVDVVSIQHEYGVWGGSDGAWVLDFIRDLTVPAVATLHTVLREPTLSQRAILVELIDRSAATIVMSRSAGQLLARSYRVDPSRLRVIPHGVPDVPLVNPETMKPRLGLTGQRTILSFGLLGPGKGYELALDALPAIVARHPRALYVIVGATHPNLVRSEGERYRTSLVDRARRLGVADHVRFVDRFVDRVELIRWLESADVFVTPYPNLDQIVSGTLSFAMGAGRAVVSTPYAYAKELLADGRGMLVEPGSASALATAIGDLLADDELRAAYGRAAYEYGRRMIWSEVGGAYRRVLQSVLAEPIRPVLTSRATVAHV